jgi:hypothetical protein
MKTEYPNSQAFGISSERDLVWIIDRFLRSDLRIPCLREWIIRQNCDDLRRDRIGCPTPSEYGLIPRDESFRIFVLKFQRNNLHPTTYRDPDLLLRPDTFRETFGMDRKHSIHREQRPLDLLLPTKGWSDILVSNEARYLLLSEQQFQSSSLILMLGKMADEKPEQGCVRPFRRRHNNGRGYTGKVHPQFIGNGE